MKKGKVDILQGNINNVLFRLSLPMIYGFFSVIGVSLVDAYFIGMLGTEELAAFGFVFPVIFTFNGLILGIGNGSSALVARAYGAGDIPKAKRFTSDALILGISLIFILSIIGLFTIEPLFKMLGAEGRILELVKSYMQIWYWGAVFVVFPMIGNSAMTAIGDTRTPSLIMLLVLVFNSILDPILIIGALGFPKMGFAGAALATVLSRIFVLFFSLYVLLVKDKILSLELPKLKELFLNWQKILYIGLPNAATNIIVPLGFGVITHISARFGNEAVAAIAVAERVESLSITVVLALAVAMSPFVGQNLGAKNFQRIKEGLRKAYKFAILYGLAMMAFLVPFSGIIIKIFNDDPRVAAYFAEYFYLVPISYGFFGIMFISSVTLNVYNKPFHSSMLTLTRVFFAYIPLALILSNYYGMWGIYIAGFFANITAGVLAFYILRKQSRLVLVH